MRDPRDIRYATTIHTARRFRGADEPDDRCAAAPHGGAIDEAVTTLAPDVATMVVHTVDEVAAVLRVSSKTVRRRIKSGEIRTVPMGGRLVRISDAELQRILRGDSIEPADGESTTYQILGQEE